MTRPEEPSTVHRESRQHLEVGSPHQACPENTSQPGETAGSRGRNGPANHGPHVEADRVGQDRGWAAAARAALPPKGAAAVGVITPGGEGIIVQGHLRRNGPAVGEHTGFELGSITKTFTALLLADLAAAGVVGYDDTIEQHLPGHAVPADRDARAITLRQLATHSSGLPHMPLNLWPRALPVLFTNPYSRYTPAHLQRALSRARPRRPPGTAYTYSTFGFGLLGEILATATGTPYARLVADRICAPLGMTDTGTTAQHDPRRATGHLRRGRPIPPMRLPAIPGAGALVSSAADLLRYAHAHLNPASHPLTAAVTAVRTPQPTLPHTPDRLSLCWNLRTTGGMDMYFHSGATSGSNAFIGLVPQAGTALVAVNAIAYDRRTPQTARYMRELKALLRAMAPQDFETRPP